ncbi:TPA: hypothetical protein U5D50_004263 [Yersinia enterocolitica]|nr:hypothetical protein [Yersinia enterocolitica]
MSVGDTFYLGKIVENVKDDFNAVCEAWIERERCVYKFYATWTFPTKENRSLIITYGDFKLQKGGNIEFSNDMKGVKEFALVSRYLDFFIRKLSPDDIRHYRKNGIPPLFSGLWIGKNFVSKKRCVVMINGKHAVRFVRCENYMPTNQMEAIVSIGIATNQIKF